MVSNKHGPNLRLQVTSALLRVLRGEIEVYVQNGATFDHVFDRRFLNYCEMF